MIAFLAHFEQHLQNIMTRLNTFQYAMCWNRLKYVKIFSIDEIYYELFWYDTTVLQVLQPMIKFPSIWYHHSQTTGVI